MGNADSTLGVVRIVRARYKALYIGGGVIVVSVVENYVFAFLPGLVAHILDALAQAAFVLSATRSFRVAGEPLAPPRPWWRATGRPLSGYVLTGVFALGAFITAATEPRGVPENLPGWWLKVVLTAAMGVYYLHSSIRLSREYAADRVITEGDEESIEPSILLWLFALAHRDGAQAPEGTADRARSRFDAPRLRFAVAGEPRHPSGFALTGADGVLALLAVAPEHLRRGVGHVLLADAIGAASRAGLERMLLDVRVDNAPAIALYESFGFHPAGDPAAHPLGGPPIQRYTLTLAAASARFPQL